MVITKAGESQEFACTSSVQEFIAPFDGLYMLECMGGTGGRASKDLTNTSAYNWGNGGVSSYGGGYSSGYIVLNQGDSLYICVGGNGDNTYQFGGYNGGGMGSGAYGKGGGGATHIARTNRGTLNNYYSYRDEILLVAGGGGGSCGYNDNGGNNHIWGVGGTGGGLQSGAGSTYSPRNGKTNHNDAATQDSGYAFGVGQPGWSQNNRGGTGGGGGGWMGGYAGIDSGGGAGGSGYIGGTPEIRFNGKVYIPKTYNSGESTGRAKITFMEKPGTNISIGTIDIIGISVGDVEVDLKVG